MRAHARTGVVVTAVSVAVSFLTVGVPGLGAAHAANGVPASADAATWAYGALRTVTASGSAAGFHYSASVTAGFSVVLNETSPSPGNYTLYANRTMGIVLSVQFCKPNCGSPSVLAVVQFHKWEAVDAVVNLTDAASVTSGSITLPALGLTSSHLALQDGLQGNTTITEAGAVVGSRALSVDVTGNSSTTFTPALGLVPLNVTASTAWNSTSAFLEDGNGSWSVSDLRTGILHLLAPNVTRSGSVSFALTGVVDLSGYDPGSTVTLGGAHYDQLNLTLTGPFSLREGFLLVPDAADLFGALPAWFPTGVVGAANANVSQANIDVTSRLMAGSHLGFEGSGSWWTSGTPNPAAEAVAVSGTGPSPALDEPASGTNATYVQGGPESVAEAATSQHCLTTGLGCPGNASPRGLFGVVLLAALGVVAAIVALAVITERRRMPPTAFPNAALYPPGSPSGAPASALRPPRRPTPPAEDDPLGHLW